MIYCKPLSPSELLPDTFTTFHHDQRWTKQWLLCNGECQLADISGHRTWNAEKRIWVSDYLTQQLLCGGPVIAAFDDETLIGFASLDGKISKEPIRYANLSMLFVDDRFQRRGIGRLLIAKIAEEARRLGAEKLFISSVPSDDTVAFYFAVGCRDAETVIPEFADAEKDRPLELQL